jgi:hypothetical protein
VEGTGRLRCNSDESWQSDGVVDDAVLGVVQEELDRVIAALVCTSAPTQRNAPRSDAGNSS